MSKEPADELVGHFLGNKYLQFVILSGTSISLYNVIDGKEYNILTQSLFGTGRCIQRLKLSGIDLLVAIMARLF